jgi:hypothetical protein
LVKYSIPEFTADEGIENKPKLKIYKRVSKNTPILTLKQNFLKSF